MTRAIAAVAFLTGLIAVVAAVTALFTSASPGPTADDMCQPLEEVAWVAVVDRRAGRPAQALLDFYADLQPQCRVEESRAWCDRWLRHVTVTVNAAYATGTGALEYLPAAAYSRCMEAEQ